MINCHILLQTTFST